MSTETETDADRVNRQIVESFVLRARRIAKHSLVLDREKLSKLSSGQFTIQFTADHKPVSMKYNLPDEEQLESLAARVRPLFLESDTPSLPRVIGALSYFLRDEAQRPNRERLAGLRKDFATLKSLTTSDDLSNSQAAYSVQMREANGTTLTLTVFELADAWLNIDVVHSDPDRHAAALAVGLRERFRAASLIYPRGALYAVSLLDGIHKMFDDKLLPLTATVWDDAVVALDTDEPVQLRVGFAPVGATVPPIGEDFGEDWTTSSQFPSASSGR